MRQEHLTYLCCPDCQSELRLAKVEERQGEAIETGELACRGCGASYPILRHIPRFVPIDNYASGFGMQWTLHSRTQYDAYSGANLTAARFFEETGWPNRLEGQALLEVGSGSGRFTEVAASTRAMVLSLDYSYAVEANYATNGSRPNVMIVQGDIYRMPFRRGSFEKVLCIGVIQHTPDPEAAFLSLAPFLKPGGSLVVDVYKKTFASYVLGTKYWVRPITRRMEPEVLYRWTRRYIDAMWPLASFVRKIPQIGPALNWRLLVADHSESDLDEAMLKEWAYLDTFDMLSPRYDYPQTLGTVRRWFTEAGLTDVVVQYGYNGIEGRGTRPILEK